MFHVVLHGNYFDLNIQVIYDYSQDIHDIKVVNILNICLQVIHLSFVIGVEDIHDKHT